MTVCEGGRERPVLTEERARAILREYPDADLSAFVIEGGASVDDLAAEEVSAVLDALASLAEEPQS